MATHSSILAWKNLWVEELGGLQSTGHLRVGHTPHILAKRELENEEPM